MGGEWQLQAVSAEFCRLAAEFPQNQQGKVDPKRTRDQVAAEEWQRDGAQKLEFQIGGKVAGRVSALIVQIAKHKRVQELQQQQQQPTDQPH